MLSVIQSAKNSTIVGDPADIEAARNILKYYELTSHKEIMEAALSTQINADKTKREKRSASFSKWDKFVFSAQFLAGVIAHKVKLSHAKISEKLAANKEAMLEAGSDAGQTLARGRLLKSTADNVDSGDHEAAQIYAARLGLESLMDVAKFLGR